MVLSSQLLQLSCAELELAIETELVENPALERVDDFREAPTDEEAMRTVAPEFLKLDKDDYEARRAAPADEAGPEWQDFVSSPVQLSDYVRAQLLRTAPPHLLGVAVHLLESLDDRGYLDEQIESVALQLNADLDDVEAALELLQRCEPAGIGARSLQECLLLQLRKADCLEDKIARVIVRDHFQDLIARKTMRLAKTFGVHPEVVEAAFRQIRELAPYPCETVSLGTRSRELRATIEPDLIYERSERGWSIEIGGPRANDLRISRTYECRAAELKEIRRADADEKRHVSTFVGRTRMFLKALDQRLDTMTKLGQELLRQQESFIQTGQYEFLRSLTKTDLAKASGVHESSVSRATAGKFVQIATGEIVPFEVFFRPALRVQKMIEEILRSEPTGRPLSDEQIGELLAKKGVVVARRTVNKYRDRTRLLSSHRRRSA